MQRNKKRITAWAVVDEKGVPFYFFDSLPGTEEIRDAAWEYAEREIDPTLVKLTGTFTPKRKGKK